MPVRMRTLQRKCACGGDAACEGCEQKKQLSLKPAGELALSQPGDAQEHEADKTAAAVMNRPIDYRPSAPAPPLVGAPRIVDDVLQDSGQPLDIRTRTFMESRFGHDFGNVRVHTDEKAGRSARAINAAAYTSESHVVFSPAAYAPHTDDGKELLAHELAHVIQQRGAVQRRIQRRLLFSSTLKICHWQLDSREFEVKDGNVKVGIDARWEGPDEGAASCETHRTSPYQVSLRKKGFIFDDSYGDCDFDPEGPSTRVWRGIPPGTYYLTIWGANTNPNCCLEGVIDAFDEPATQGESCTKVPDDSLTILHGALDLLGLIPALGAIPDAINTSIYLVEGDWANAGLSAIAIIPLLGDGVTLAKDGIKLTNAAVKRLGKEGIEAGFKEARAVEKLTAKETSAVEKEVVKEGETVEKQTLKEGETAVKETEKLAGTVTECEALYAAYKTIGPCGSCKNATSKTEIAAVIACLTAEIAGREAYLKKKCDYVLPGSIGRGSAIAERGHKQQRDQLLVVLAKCTAKLAGL
ncbi:MAG TPA: DUF4157 domain-containing protein [Thermoanaerobaculia bacterium]